MSKTITSGSETLHAAFPRSSKRPRRSPWTRGRNSGIPTPESHSVGLRFRVTYGGGELKSLDEFVAWFTAQR